MTRQLCLGYSPGKYQDFKIYNMLFLWSCPTYRFQVNKLLDVDVMDQDFPTYIFIFRCHMPNQPLALDLHSNHICMALKGIGMLWLIGLICEVNHAWRLLVESLLCPEINRLKLYYFYNIFWSYVTVSSSNMWSGDLDNALEN